MSNKLSRLMKVYIATRNKMKKAVKKKKLYMCFILWIDLCTWIRLITSKYMIVKTQEGDD